MQGLALMPRFRSNLKQLMLKKSVELGEPLNQSKVAEHTGLSLPTIGRWYKDDVDRLEAGTIAKLCDFLGCTFEELVTFLPDEEGGQQ